MKRLLVFLGLIFVAVSLRADDLKIDVDYNLTPGFKTATSVTKSSFTITAPSSSQENCLTGWSMMSTTLANMEIIDGTLSSGTTLWAMVNVPASTPINIALPREDAICADNAKTLVLAVSSGTVSMNYRGYVKRNR